MRTALRCSTAVRQQKDAAGNNPPQRLPNVLRCLQSALPLFEVHYFFTTFLVKLERRPPARQTGQYRYCRGAECVVDSTLMDRQRLQLLTPHKTHISAPHG